MSGCSSLTKLPQKIIILNILNLSGCTGLKTLPKNLDSTDGLAAAVCHFFNSGKEVGEKSYTGWDAFVKNNEKRIN